MINFIIHCSSNDDAVYWKDLEMDSASLHEVSSRRQAIIVSHGISKWPRERHLCHGGFEF